MRHDIRAGVLRGRVTEEGLRTRYGAILSRWTVRQALAALKEEGLVTATRRGTFIMTPGE